MEFIKGISYNFRGLGFGLKSFKLLLLGLLRFVTIILITVIAAGLILTYKNEIINIIWTRPENTWIVWLWHVLSWFLSLVLVGVSAILSYLVSQIFFNVIIMDVMSKITERMVTETAKEAGGASIFKQFAYLISQEIPRTTLPVLLSLLIMLLGWLTPLGPIFAILSSVCAILFLSWDNTDLVPARRMEPFKKRFKYLMRTIPFHLGFGLPFLIPGLNILLLSFAPVGATLYHVKELDQKETGG